MKARFRAPLAALACAAAVFAAGCSDDENPVTPTPFSQADADDIAAQAGQALAVGTIVNLGASAGASAGGSASPAARFDPERAASFAQADTTFMIGNVTYTLGVTFYDANGAELPVYGPLAVRMHVTTRATGSWSSQQFEASLGHSGMLDVTGIEAARDTLGFDGASRDSVDASFQSLDGQRTRYFKWRSASVLADVLLLKDRQANPYPLRGTATYVVHAVRYRSDQFSEVERTWDATVVVHFDGTATPDLVVNGTFRYYVNLITGVVQRAPVAEVFRR